VHSAPGIACDARAESGYPVGLGVRKKDSSMKKMIVLAALLLASPAWAQGDTARPAAEAAKPAPEAAKPAPKNVGKATSRRHLDARHCLQRASNDAIIRCAEEYL
jgi:hypothetical protein